jgi:hypothetical protein
MQALFRPDSALLAERLAVGALGHSGIQFVGAHGDLLQRAEVLGVTVVGALGDGTRNTLVGITETVAHGSFLLHHWHGFRIPECRFNMLPSIEKYNISA